jgi:hypothetical protein
MIKVLVLVEGQTEETFITELLAPHLAARQVYPIPKLLTTKRVKNGPDFKGGVFSYGKIRNDSVRLLQDTSAALVTTLLDFYGLPSDFPGVKTMQVRSCYDQVVYLEKKFQEDIAHRKFMPYLALHEFEAMLFAAPDKIAQTFPEARIEPEVRSIREQFASPEEIDNDPTTAPSKRLERLLPFYQKPLHGPLVLLDIGIEQIRTECRHFNEWLTRLEGLGD